MIFKRAVARLRAQDWVAITIELAIVIVGVFIGLQVANWNEELAPIDECPISTHCRHWELQPIDTPTIR